MADHITPHHGGGWLYQFHVPIPLRPFLGNKAAVRRYIKRMPRREAESIARRWAVEDEAELAVYRQVPHPDRKELATGGGLPAILNDDRRFLLPAENERRKMARAIHQKVEQTKPAVLSLSWDGLFAEWKKIKVPNGTRNHARTIHLLKEFFGERVNCRDITPQDIGRFRDNLTGKKLTLLVVAQHLNRVHAMFAAAAGEPTSPFASMINPSAGVKVLGKPKPPKDGDDRAFTPQQIQTILETAKRIKFGFGRHAEILWALRLLAFTGMRPNEVFMLQGGDVLQLEGVKTVRISETDALTGNKHPEKSIKTREKRLVPLHPQVLDFFDYANAGFAKDAFIFGAFPWNEYNGRASWLTSRFPKFLINKCKIEEPTKNLTLYSLRHAFITAMRNAKVPKEQRNQIVGHGKDIGARYGANDLPLLRDYVASTKPILE